MSLFVAALFVACAPPSGPAPVALAPAEATASGIDPAWRAEVSARIADAAHAFVVDGDGFRATVPERGLKARFDAGGARLSLADDTVVVRTPGGAPTLGACLADRVDPAGDCVRRLEYVGDSVTEWWAADARGFEQGWTVHAAPVGALALEVSVDGAEVTVEDDAVWLQGGAGGLLRVEGLAAWDADGVPLDAWFEPAGRAGDAWVVRVDATDARYPVEIDPLYSTPAWTADGHRADGGFAESAVGAGDVNGDGYDDVIVGAYAAGEHTGLAYVYLGSASGLSSTASTTLSGESEEDSFGVSVSGAGDLNGDGYDDVVVGAPGYGPYTGRAYVHYGAASGVSASPGLVLTGAAISDRFGQSVSGAGDVNADGYDDIVVGAWYAGGAVGSASVYLGSATGVSSTAATTLTGEGTSTYFGLSVSDAGDVDGDGYDDVIVGASAYASSTGRAYVFHGTATGVSTTATSTLTGERAGDGLGYAVSGAGDVNGDGYDDVVVGAPHYNTDAGRAYVHLGSASGVDPAASTGMSGSTPTGRLGWSVSRAGDVNADGYDDVIVGEYASMPGSAFVYLGGSSGLSRTAATTLTELGRYFGRSVADAGDVDGDGYDDLIVGAMLAESAYVYAGGPDGVASTAEVTLAGDPSAHALGVAVAGAGDVNADGLGDVIVGAQGYSDDRGRAYVYLGTTTGLAATAATTLDGEEGWFGGAVAGAGDVNGDGYDDVIVGAVGYRGNAGRAYVYLGYSAGVATVPSARITGEMPSTGVGISVAGAGDVNADGYDDVVVGAHEDGMNVGSASVHLGSPTGVSERASVTLTGEDTSNYFGLSVAGAGDVDADGYADVIVGAYGYGASAGRAYVFLGSAGGISGGAATVLAGSGTERLGFAVAGAGDTNGDGYDDVAVGAYRYDADTGRVYVYAGSASGVSTAAATTLTGESTSDLFGRTVAGAGDVDGDGYDDLVVGAYAASGGGRAYLYPGSPSGIATDPATVLLGMAPESYGAAVAGAGDVDGDGYADVLVGDASYYFDGGRAYLYLGYDPATDADLDGVESDVDCDDGDTGVREGTLRYPDADGDGYGAVGTIVCADTAGYVDVPGDCDDGDPGVSPARIETCDGVDQDCDGVADDDATDFAIWYADSDLDGYGDAAAPVSACTAPPGFVATGTDCDEGAGAVNPAAVESCNGVDDDCDGAIDPDDALGAVTGYRDADGDGYGWAGTTTTACALPPGYVGDASDCDDGRADAYPGAAEAWYDGVDQDCAGGGDFDADGDGHDAAPHGGDDCDDTAAAVHPAAAEVDGNGIDDDCDGTVDVEEDTGVEDTGDGDTGDGDTGDEDTGDGDTGVEDTGDEDTGDGDTGDGDTGDGDTGGKAPVEEDPGEAAACGCGVGTPAAGPALLGLLLLAWRRSGPSVWPLRASTAPPRRPSV